MNRTRLLDSIVANRPDSDGQESLNGVFAYVMGSLYATSLANLYPEDYAFASRNDRRVLFTLLSSMCSNFKSLHRSIAESIVFSYYQARLDLSNIPSYSPVSAFEFFASPIVASDNYFGGAQAALESGAFALASTTPAMYGAIMTLASADLLFSANDIAQQGGSTTLASFVYTWRSVPTASQSGSLCFCKRTAHLISTMRQLLEWFLVLSIPLDATNGIDARSGNIFDWDLFQKMVTTEALPQIAQQISPSRPSSEEIAAADFVVAGSILDGIANKMAQSTSGATFFSLGYMPPSFAPITANWDDFFQYANRIYTDVYDDQWDVLQTE